MRVEVIRIPTLALCVLALVPTLLRAEPLVVEVPGEPLLRIPTVSVDGLDHIALEDFLEATRRVDPEAEFRWDNAQTLRLRVLGQRISLFTDRALILVGTRLSPTSGPLISRGGEILVPAASLRDLFGILPAETGATVTLPSPPPVTPLEPTLAITPPRPTPAPQLPSPQPSLVPPTVSPGLITGPPPPTTPTFNQMSGVGPIVLVGILNGSDQSAIGGVLNLLQGQIERGTQCEVVTLTVDNENWEPALVAIESLQPALVLAMQVGHSARADLTGVGIYQMSPAVESQSLLQSSARDRAVRYLGSSRESGILAAHVERELRRTGMPWLGNLPVPHRLLRACPSPAVLIELGQISNPEERAMLATDSHQALLAGAIAQGVIDHWQTTAQRRQRGVQ